MRKTTQQADELFELVTHLYFDILNHSLEVYKTFYFDPYDNRSTADIIRQLLRKVLYLCGYRDKSLSDKVSVLSKAFLRAYAEGIETKEDWYDVLEYNGGIYSYGRTYKTSKKLKKIVQYEEPRKSKPKIFTIKEISKSLVNIRKTKKVYRGW